MACQAPLFMEYRTEPVNFLYPSLKISDANTQNKLTHNSFHSDTSAKEYFINILYYEKCFHKNTEDIQHFSSVKV